jgi:hypothetical protein
MSDTTSVELREVVAADPKLGVLIAYGMDDLAFPYFVTRIVLDQMPTSGGPTASISSSSRAATCSTAGATVLPRSSAQRWRFTIEPMASMRSGLVVSIEIVHN